MNEDLIIDHVAEHFTCSIKKQMIMGFLPSSSVENILFPLLENFNLIYPKLSKSAKNEIKGILKLYPEITIKYNIEINTLYRLLIGIIQLINGLHTTIKHYIQDCFSDWSQIKTLRYAPAFTSLFIFILILSIFFLKNETAYLSSNEIIAQLKHDKRINTFQITHIQKTIHRNTVGFMSADRFPMNFFQLGFICANINLALENNQVDEIVQQIKSINLLTQFENEVQNKIKQNIDKLLSPPISRDDAIEFVLTVERISKQNNNFDLFRFGEWCSVFLSLIESDYIHVIPQIVQDNTIKYISAYFKSKDTAISNSVINALNQIKQLADKDPLEDKHISLIKKELKRIVDLLIDK